MLQYVTPLFLALILAGFALDTLPKILGQSAGLSVWLARAIMVAVFGALALLARHTLRGDLEEPTG